MKKVIFGTLAIAAIVILGFFIWSKKPVEPVKVSDFNKYLVEDYDYVKSLYPENEVIFYEAEVTLNGSPAELGEKAEPVSVKEIYQVDTTVVFIDRVYADEKFDIETVPGFWCEDVPVNPEGIADFKDALKALLSADIITPDAVFVTLRNPLGPVIFENPFYVFGSNLSGFVAVDAKTLEIQEFNAIKGELKDSRE